MGSSSAQHHQGFTTSGNGSSYTLSSDYLTTSPFHAGTVPGHYTGPVGGGFAAMLWLQQRETYLFLLLQFMAVAFAFVASTLDKSAEKKYEEEFKRETVRRTVSIPEGKELNFS